MSRKHDPTMEYLPTAFETSDDPEAGITRVLGREGAPTKKTTTTGGPCATCGNPVSGKFVSEGEKRWHIDCYSREHSCFTCGAPIIGQRTEACGKQYHPGCLRCGNTTCGRVITSKYVERFESPFCSQECADSAPVQAPTLPARTQQAPRSAGAGPEYQAEFCCQCGKPITTSECVELPGTGLVYHAPCFTCSVCHCVIGTAKFSLEGTTPVCLSCRDRRAPPCKACGKPATGSFVSTPDGGRFHDACFVCSRCGKQITGPFAEGPRGKPVCAACVDKPAPAPVRVTTTATTTVQKPGLRVDPRSGQRSVATSSAAAPPRRFCTQCGAQLVDTDRFCGSCGNART